MSNYTHSSNNSGTTTTTISSNNSNISNNSNKSRKPWTTQSARRTENPSKTVFKSIYPDHELSTGIFTPNKVSLAHKLQPNTQWPELPIIMKLLQQAKPINKSQTYLDIYQNHDNQFANILLRCDKITNLMGNIIKTELASIFESRRIIGNHLIPNNMRGGHDNIIANMNIVNELNKKEGDSQHDFKPSESRNNIFPLKIAMGKKLNNIVNGSIVLDKISEIVFNSKGVQSRELNSYFEKNPTHFEEDIKVDYLLGDLAGELDDISYYFTDVGETPSTWDTMRRNFFENVEINGIDKLFADITDKGIDYWLFDACMSSSIKNKIPVEKFTTLANLWDPAKSKNPVLSELTEYKMSNDPQSKGISIFVEDEQINYADKKIKFYDWRNNNGRSYYDEIYTPLINMDIMTDTFGIEIKLRIALINNICYIAICVFVADRFKDVVIVNSGFSVNELAMGMHYIETEELEYNNNHKRHGQTIRSELKTLLDILYKHFVDVSKTRKETSQIFLKNEYYKLLLRFKSSGDHGSARTVKILNELLKKTTVFVSGDNLAYVYSIADTIPTIGRYYQASSKNKSEEDDDDDEDTHSSAPQFIVGYFPMVDTPEKYAKQFNKKISVIGSIKNTTYENPNYSKTPNSIQMNKNDYTKFMRIIIELTSNINTFIDSNVKYNKDIKYSSNGDKKTKPLNMQSSALEDSISKKISEIFYTKIKINNADIDIMKVFEAIPNNMNNLFLNGNTYDFAAMKQCNSIINDFMKNCYFMKNYIKIVQLVKQNMSNFIKFISDIVRIDDDDIMSSKETISKEGRHRGRQSTNIQGLINNFKNYNGTITKEQIENAAENIGTWKKSEKTSLREELLLMYSRLITIKKGLSTTMIRELKMDSTFYREIAEKIEDLKLEYYINLQNKINEIDKIGPALNDFFAKCFKITESVKREKGENDNILISEISEVLQDEKIEEIPSVFQFEKPKSVLGKKEKKQTEIILEKIIVDTISDDLQIGASVVHNGKQGVITRYRSNDTYDIRYVDKTKALNVNKSEIISTERGAQQIKTSSPQQNKIKLQYIPPQPPVSSQIKTRSQQNKQASLQQINTRSLRSSKRGGRKTYKNRFRLRKQK